MSIKDELASKHPTINSRFMDAKKSAEGLAGLYNSDEDEVKAEDGGLDALFLVRNKAEEVERYVIHLRKMLLEGEGETVIELGAPIELSGKDYKSALSNQFLLASGIPTKDLDIAVTNHVKILASIPAIGTKLETRTNGGKSTEVWLVRVAVVGNVDAGKSTLLGVLTHKALDDGRGLARTKLFRHKHEFESGRTSSVGNDILGFDVHGEVVNNPDPHNNKLDWVQISKECSKLITFIDLAGHEKYLKTTIFGMTGHMPDYTMLMVGANMGIIGTTKEHLSLALSLSVPVFIVVTKIDMCPPQILEETMKNIGRLVKSAGARKLPVMVRNTNDVIHAAVNFPSKRVCPIFQVSNVEGTNLDLLRQFLNIVPLRRTLCEDDPAHFQVPLIFFHIRQ
ncbi:elongation factor Tu GTP binding domain protein [Dictyocaulus viviparus]|uniref:Elongation factor Tu GTP binding domain protein n=1 Tax=Dictyocaulus viviparus TaxID=29172 RepID=A0A0D8XZQ9_DICVI|nr:elongation factor Tu GTP binding domain protein [Dictyocaulus viviparus]